ncbi:MAG: hypothetical protein JW741_18215 [Sedimentisphaerales bacterium]|nr:hypothetical protein [Sedimentisphaerales bacterium]
MVHRFQMQGGLGMGVEGAMEVLLEVQHTTWWIIHRCQAVGVARDCTGRLGEVILLLVAPVEVWCKSQWTESCDWRA